MADKEDKKRKLFEQRKQALEFVNTYLRSDGFNERLSKAPAYKYLQLKKGRLAYAPTLEIIDNYDNANYVSTDNSIIYGIDHDENSIKSNDPYKYYINNRGTKVSSLPEGGVMTHEIGHFVDDVLSKGYNYQPKNTQEAKKHYGIFGNNVGVHSLNYGDLLKSKKAINDHDSEEWENYADIFALRKILYEDGIYDSTKANNPFTKEHLLKAKEKYKDKFIRSFLNFDDEQLIQIMNTVAKNNENNNYDNRLSLEDIYYG